MDKCQHSTIGFINTSQRTIPAHFQQCFMTDANKMIINSSIKSHPYMFMKVPRAIATYFQII